MASFQQQQGSAHAAPTPCAAGCGFFGSPGTLDMCSVCYKKHCPASSAEPGSNSNSAAMPRSAAADAVTGTAAAGVISFAPALKATATSVAEAAAVPSSSATGAAKKAQPTRCAACCKKVGLTGFVCRCQKTFCGTHRYAEEHGCSFDFKAAGRDAIARSNPIVKGEKLSGKI